MVEDVVAVQGVQSAAQPEDLARAVQRVHQPVHVLARVVDVERGARRGAHAEHAHQRLRAVVAGAHAHGLAVAQLGDVVRVHPLDRERHDAAAPVHVGGP